MSTEKSFEQWTPADRERVLEQLGRVLESRTFAAAARLQHLLRYVVTETVSGRGARVNQASIAIDVLGRDEKFDPAVDSVVRVEAGRLRTKLRDYYDEEGRNDPIRIELPKGMYQPRIRFGGPAAGPAGPSGAAPAPEAGVPKGTARRVPVREFGIGIAVTFVVLAAVFVRDHVLPPADEPALPVVAPVFDGAKSLAVLPFLNSSAASEDAGFFADGLHDDLLTQLTKIADLTVISRTSVMGYRDVQKPIPQIAEELGVHAVLEGAVQRAGDRVRVNVQLIDGRSDKHLWAESFDQELNATNIFEIQRRIATEIATALHATLSPQERTRLAVLPTQSFEAYEAYLKARQRLTRRTLEDIDAASGLFEQAIGLDPDFALAHAGLAESWYLLNSYGGLTQADTLARAKPALDRAFALNDQIGEAWTVLGGLRNLEGDEAGAERAFLRAIELNPNYAQAYHWYGTLLSVKEDRAEEFLDLARRARDLDPLSPLLRVNIAIALESLGRPDEAEAELRRGMELDPDFAVARDVMGYLQLFSRQDVPEALRWFARARSTNSSVDADTGIVQCYLMLGNVEQARPWMDRFRATANDADIRSLGEVLWESVAGDRVRAAALARDFVGTTGKHVKKERFFLLQLLRDDDLARGRYADARARYAAAAPELLATAPTVRRLSLRAAIDLALVLQNMGETRQATALLAGAAELLPALQRLGSDGYTLADAEIAALRGDKPGALAALRRAIDEGWLGYWLERPDRSPNLALLHGDPAFEAMLEEVRAKLAVQAARVRELELAGEIPPPPAA